MGRSLKVLLILRPWTGHNPLLHMEEGSPHGTTTPNRPPRPSLAVGHHPVSMKKAYGIGHDKPGKPSYDSPRSFSVIVLLQTVSKIFERVLASHLSLLARSLKLLRHNQCASLPALSSFDTALTLVDTVRTLQRPGLHVSTLFGDIKGGFDNVNASIQCSSFKRTEFPTTWSRGLAPSSPREPAVYCFKDHLRPSPQSRSAHRKAPQYPLYCSSYMWHPLR